MYAPGHKTFTMKFSKRLKDGDHDLTYSHTKTPSDAPGKQAF